MSVLKRDKSHNNNDTVHRGFASVIFRDTSHYPIAIRTIAGTTEWRYIILSYSLKTTRFARGIERDSTRPISLLSPRDNRVVLLYPCKCICTPDTFKYPVRFPKGRGRVGGGTVTNRRFRVNYGRREKKEHSFRRAAGLNGKYIALARVIREFCP